MKPYLYLLLCFIVLFQLCSCKHTNDRILFTNSSVKKMFDEKCIGCHGKGMSAEREWLYDANDYKHCIKDKKDDLYETVYQKKSMPQGMSLTQQQMDDFKSWYDAGCPAN